MARPSKFNSERIDKIVNLIRLGNFAETAAAAAGISKQTYYNWLARGKAERERIDETGTKAKASEKHFLEFFDAVEGARAEAEARMVALISTAAQDPTKWQAAAWWLERVAPQKYGRINRTEISGPDGAPIQSETKSIQYSEAEIIALADEILGLNVDTSESENANG